VSFRRRVLPAALAAATLTAGGLLAVPSAASASLLPSAALPGTAPLHLNGALDEGAAAADARQRVVVVLALRDPAGLQALLRDQQNPASPSYRQWLSPAEFAARFAPDSSVVDAAKAWATAAGLTVTDVSSNRTLVTLEGTRAQLGSAFGVQLHQMSLAGKTFVTPDRTATLPAALRGAAASVLGLTTYNPNTTPHHVAKPADAYQPYGAATYGPHDFETMYDAPAATTGAGQTIAVITQGDLSGVAKDLTTFETRNNLPNVPLTVINTTATSTDTSGADEYDLDTQYSTGFAPDVSSLLAYNSDTLGDVHPLNAFVTDKRALTASASYGGCEVLNALLGDVAADDQVFEQAQAQGQTFWVSSGDEGSACSVLVNAGGPVGVPDVEYPASSPYVVAVGGTSLTGQTTQPTREITWIGGGGGYSNIESAPAWQADNLAFVGAVGRGVPDVSLDADPSSGYTVVVGGTDTTIGGTSASAPAWNGIWARVQQAKPGLGFAAPVLYRSASALTDITLGTNGLYAALPGYDLSTGLGSADIAKLVAAAH
jgi:subtilase family serine protease